MELSVLIVVLHYRSLSDTMECLASLERQTYGSMRTLVIDNGSADAVTGTIKDAFPWAEVIALRHNLGWSGGNNLGIRTALARKCDMVCLLNNDTVLPPHAIQTLMNTASRLGPCILHPAIDSYGTDTDVQLDPALPEPPHIRAIPIPGHETVFEIDLLNGSCSFIHCDVFRNIGLIDERFFLLCEDADLGARAVAAGYKLFCDSSVRIQHKESRGFGGRRTPIKTYYGLRNTLLYWEKRGWRRVPPLHAGRTIAWTAWQTADVAGVRPGSWWDVLRWLLSRDIYARAVRWGLRDYLLRRFGQISASSEAVLALIDRNNIMMLPSKH